MNHRDVAREITGRGPAIEAIVEASFERPITLVEAEALFSAETIKSRFHGRLTPETLFRVRFEQHGICWTATVEAEPANA